MSKAETLLSQEREAWTREKLRLEKALHLSQSQVARLRGEIRSDTLREISGPESDNSALKVKETKRLCCRSFYLEDQVFFIKAYGQVCDSSSLLLASLENVREVPEVRKF